VKVFLDDIRKIIKAGLGLSAAELIDWLNPKIRGWANYHRHAVSKRVFQRVDHTIFFSLWQWARRRHPEKSRGWLKQKYFERLGQDNWRSSGNRATTTAYCKKYDCCPLVTRPFNDTLRSKAKPTRTILFMSPTSKNAKVIIWRKRFGVREHFVFSGSCSVASAPCVT
jgi:hypothetical protein